jgi:hypothetical protein
MRSGRTSARLMLFTLTSNGVMSGAAATARTAMQGFCNQEAAAFVLGHLKLSFQKRNVFILMYRSMVYHWIGI